MDRDKSALGASESRRGAVKRTAPKPLTTASISALKPGKLLADGAIRPGSGSLKIRKRLTSGGIVCEWIFEWSRAGKTVRQTIGRYSVSETTDCLTLALARIEAGRLQAVIKSGNDPIVQRDAERQAARARVEVDRAQIEHANEKSLAALLDAYVESLKEKGKVKSAYDAKNIFENHIHAPFPEIASLPAADVTPEHFSKILTRLVRPEDGDVKGRTALKLRSYAGAAYKMALGANIDPMAASTAKDFGLSINPVAVIPVTKMAEKFNRAGERTLSTEELAEYLCHVAALEHGLPKLALQLQIATCGQRMQQLLRLTHANITDSTLTLYDPKGKRTRPRVHILPIIPEVDEVLSALRLMNPPSEEDGENTSLFLSRGSIVALESISGLVQNISESMLKNGVSDSTFRAGDIRRTVETMLAERLGITKDVRAQLLSHGLSGVQDRHYDKGAHIQAKISAMRVWNDYVENLCIGGVDVTNGEIL